MNPRHCVVLAGGLGTRIHVVTHGEIPKVLVPVLGRPFLQHKLEGLQALGVTDVTILVGELGHMVDKFLTDNPIPGLKCHLIHDGPELLGTAGAIARAMEFLPELFWVTYGDSHVVADLSAAEGLARKEKAEAIMVVFHNRDEIEASNTDVQGGYVVDYQKGVPPGTFEWIDYGLLFLPKSSFNTIPTGSKEDLYTVLSHLISRGRVIAFEATERFWDVGTPEALHDTEIEFRRRRGV